ncbi:MAG: hypothetical protein Q9209_004299 [Squamulea sp. 1 TL-2023]
MSSSSSRSATHETNAFASDSARTTKSKTGSSNTNQDSTHGMTETSVTDHELNQQMNELFDFDSAANSPGDPESIEISPEKPILGMAIPQQLQPPLQTERKDIQPQNRNGPEVRAPVTAGPASRSVVSTPSSFKPESSWQHPHFRSRPFKFDGTPSLQNNRGYNQTNSTAAGLPLAANIGFVGPNNFGFPPQMLIPPAATFHNPGQFEQVTGPRLTIEPISSKTRVETQIPIKMTLAPLPPGITKLHLPVRTMAKSKLIAKPRPSKSPDILELDVMPVCASAMRKPGVCQRALTLARGEGSSVQRSSSEGPHHEVESSGKVEPMEGGPISICDGCVLRERKRANRRIEKEETAEDVMWKQGEKDRIVVFNEAEVMEWKPFGSADVNEPAGRRGKSSGRGMKKGGFGVDVHTPTFPPGQDMQYRARAKQVRLQMRITCYCRHQGEPEGFQVILTLKDHLGNCVAQGISSPILITDDHKTSTLQQEAPSLELTDRSHLRNGGFFPAAPSINTGAAPHVFNPGQSRSTTELSSRPQHHNHPALFRPSTSVSLHQHTQSSRSTGVLNHSKHSSHRTSVTLTPHNLSRQVSPSATSGPTPKRRKASGNMSFHRPLVDLSMTRMQSTNAAAPEHRPSLSPSSSSDASEGLTMAPTAPAARTSPPAPPLSNPSQLHPQAADVDTSIDPAVAAPASSRPVPSPRQTTPPSDSDPMTGLSTSQRSGTQSPRPVQPFIDTDMTAHAQALHLSLLHLPGASAPLAVPPKVLRAYPSEGPMAGGFEICIRGEGFRDGLDVEFAGAVATRTIVHDDQLITCIVPPSAQACLARVSLRGLFQPDPQVWFRYIDTDEDDIMKLALQVLHYQNTGKHAQAIDVARSIIDNKPLDQQLSLQQHRPYRAMQRQHLCDLDVELSILSVLDLIDQADTSVAPRYNLCQSNGQTMLHLSASLGYHRLAAGLLARGANPDSRDHNGMSAMHMACLHGHTMVVRKLLSAGGDPTLRSLLGLAPIDMATTQEVYQVISSIERHIRSRSLGATPVSHLSRSSSPASIQSARATQLGERISVGDMNLALNNVVEAYRSYPVTPAQAWAQSRRNSVSESQQFLPDQAIQDAPSDTQVVTAAAAMAAWRDNLARQIQYFHQSVQRTLPNLQVPNLPPLPTFEAYQEHPMVRRISNLVPRMNAPLAPPAYEEIYPEPSPVDLKKASTARAMGDALMDTKCAVAFDTSTDSQPSLMRAINEASTKEQQEQLRLAHAMNVRNLSNDWKLYTRWIPLLVIVIALLTKDWGWVPFVVGGAQQVVGFVQEHLAA